jgi:hypothetical protein
MSAEKIKTSYPAVEPTGSFWEAVFAFIALKEAEGKQVASALMSDVVVKSGAESNGEKVKYAPRTTALQEKTFESFFALLNDTTMPRNARRGCLEAL